MTAASLAVPLHLAEVAKPRVRVASLELSARVLRASGMEEAARFLDGAQPGSIFRGRPSPRSGSRELPPEAVIRNGRCISVSAFVLDAPTIARSMRRAGLRYGALKLRQHGVYPEASDLLERAAAEVDLDGDGVVHCPGASR